MNFQNTYKKYCSAIKLNQWELAKQLAYVYNRQLKSSGGPKVFTHWHYLSLGLEKKSDLVNLLINSRRH